VIDREMSVSVRTPGDGQWCVAGLAAWLIHFALTICLLALALPAQATTVTYKASASWAAPAGVTSVDVEVWGGGGAGGGQNSTWDGGGGGGGGGYSKKTAIAVIPGTSYAVTVGGGGIDVAGESGGNGGDSYFINVSTVMARGGSGGTSYSSSYWLTPPPGGPGGQATAGVGATRYSGGTGGDGRYDKNGRGGPGGSSAGTSANGVSGPTPWLTRYAATPPTGGGIGGDGGGDGGGASGYPPASGNGGGGGGSGDGLGMIGGNGAPGKVVITYIVGATATTTAATALAATGATLNGTVTSNGLFVNAVSFEYGPTSAYGSTAPATPATLAASASNVAVHADLAGLTCSTSYHYRVKAQNGDVTSNGADMIFTTPACGVFCEPPSNVKATGIPVTCVCDTFGRANLNPSTIFGGNWVLSNSDGISNPYINQTTGLLRLTENTLKNAKSATVPSIFPAAGNYISVEFKHYAYAGNGADGMAVTLSDYSIPPVPGAFGGSLGYAQKSQSACGKVGGCPGFAGGWLGVGIDEFGNYLSPDEGRDGGPGRAVQSVGVRGPGAAQNGYRWLGGSAGVGGIDNSGSAVARGYMYQVIVDSRNSATGSVEVKVNRDAGLMDGSNYSPLFGPYNAYPEALNARNQGWTSSVVPDYWKISFTGSTGDNSNFHEIGSLRICAQSVLPATGGIASGIAAIDEANPGTPPADQYFPTGHIFMKLAGTPFKLWIAALSTTSVSGIAKDYSATMAKYVQVKLVDNSDNLCGSDAARTCSPACAGKAAVETGSGATQVATFVAGSSTGVALSPSFTLNSAYKNLVAVMMECSDATCSTFSPVAPACSADSFSVRPLSIASVISIQTPPGTLNAATNTATDGTPKFRAGSDSFALTATTTGVGAAASGYDGTMKINNAAVQAFAPATVSGMVSGTFPVAASGTPSSTASGTNFTYSEVGGFTLLGYNPDSVADAMKARGAYDDTWAVIDSVATQGDCVAGSYSNVKNSSGKYGCSFGLLPNTRVFGRFIPNEFRVSGAALVNRQAAACSPVSVFSYLDEPMGLSLTLEAWSGSGNITKNYSGDLAKLDFSTSVNGVASLVLAAAVPAPVLPAVTPPFVPLSARLSATGFAGVWPASTAAAAGTVALAGTVSISSLNSPTVPADKRAVRDGPLVGAAIGIAPQDVDGVRILNYDLDADNAGGASAADHKALASTTLYFGQLRLLPAIGSEILPLAMRAEVQRWNGAAFVPNGDDNCTRLALANLGLSDWTQNLTEGKNGAADETAITSGDLTLAAGKGTLRLSAPGKGNNGSVLVSADVSSSMPYLSGRWGGAATYGRNPSAVASFGLYKGAGQIIYFRENY
jgi:MSHA biogenesis protein MshQ